MENVNKQLLDALKEMVSIVEIHSEETDSNFAWAELSCARQAIAAAEQAKQAEPVAWLKYPRKKPELMQVSLSKHLPVALKNSGWVSEPLYAQPPAVAVPDAAVGKLRILLAACNRIEAGAEEFESQDGSEVAIAIDYWLEFIDALEAARAMLAAKEQPK